MIPSQRQNIIYNFKDIHPASDRSNGEDDDSLEWVFSGFKIDE
jgi:hypothetical protein